MSWVITDDRVRLECNGRCGNVDWMDRSDVPDGLPPELVQVELMAKALGLGWGGQSDGDIHLCPNCGDPGDDEDGAS